MLAVNNCGMDTVYEGYEYSQMMHGKDRITYLLRRLHTLRWPAIQDLPPSSIMVDTFRLPAL